MGTKRRLYAQISPVLFLAIAGYSASIGAVPIEQLPLDEASSYDGRYVAGPFEYRVGHDGGQVFVSFDHHDPVKLVPTAPGEFGYLGLRGSVRFEKGPEGKINRLIQQFGGVTMDAARRDDGETGRATPRKPASGQDYRFHAPIEPTYRDLAYASASPAEMLDLYLPTGDRGASPVVIWMHGGGFRVGDKRSIPRTNFGPPPPTVGPSGPFQIQVPDAAALTEKGYAVVSLNYRLLRQPGTQFAPAAIAAVQDAKAAIRFLRSNAAKFDLDPGKVAVWGNSAGGYIAAMLGVTSDQSTFFYAPELGNPTISSAVQAVVVWFGAADSDSFRPEVRFPHYLATAKKVPPFLIANGDADHNVSAANAREFDRLLRDRGASSTLAIVPGAKHEDPAFMTTQMEPTFRFLDGVFRREEPQGN
jgi:acetyl esterase/lipase